MIHKCVCPECIAASVRNLDALTVLVQRMATAAAHARRLLDQGDAATARELIDAATIRANDMARDMLAWALIDATKAEDAEAAPIIGERPAGPLH